MTVALSALQAALVGMLAAGFVAPAQAGLLGSQVTLVYNLSNAPSTTDTVTVGDAVEFSCPSGPHQLCMMLTAPTQTVDIGDLTIRYQYDGLGAGFNDAPVNGFDFQGLVLGGGITGVGLATDIAGLDLSRISFSASSVQVSMTGLSLPPDAFFEITLQAVPEPASALLALLGGLALAGRLRRRQA